VYDRLGFGSSTRLETYDEPWTNRTPAAIAGQLRYALLEGADPYYKRGVFWSETAYAFDNTTFVREVQVRPPFILIGHGTGGLYVRQFAHDYPEIVAGLVLVDALPAINNADAVVTSSIQKKTGLSSMMLCQAYLQPMGLIQNAFSSTISGLFQKSTKFNMEGGLPVNGSVLYQDWKAMNLFMLHRSWCPAVAAEYRGLFASAKRGIETVAAADKKGFDMPAVVFARETDMLAKKLSTAPLYLYDNKTDILKTTKKRDGGRRGGEVLNSLALLVQKHKY